MALDKLLELLEVELSTEHTVKKKNKGEAAAF